jgi:diaminohydroxyphosphoribosylaminopyrimidine deaminase/5-amino-6-(5-phosphoribosylamino)uracil reductase
VVDELVVYLAPSLIGDTGRGMFSLPPLAGLDQAPRLDLRDVRRVGADVRLILRVQGES